MCYPAFDGALRYTVTFGEFFFRENGHRACSIHDKDRTRIATGVASTIFVSAYLLGEPSVEDLAVAVGEADDWPDTDARKPPQISQSLPCYCGKFVPNLCHGGAF